MSPDPLAIDVNPVKDDEQRFIPLAWRGTISSIVGALADGNYSLEGVSSDVSLHRYGTAEKIKAAIDDYGTTILHLPEAAWNTSVCIWYESHWDVLIDLWSLEEGPSDLVIGLRVTEAYPGYKFEVQLVYVP